MAVTNAAYFTIIPLAGLTILNGYQRIGHDKGNAEIQNVFRC